jgi:hypothetical protein
MNSDARACSRDLVPAGNGGGTERLVPV